MPSRNASELDDRSEAAVAALVDEHQGAMSRLARLVGRDPGSGEAVRRAWAAALARPDDRPEGTSVRGWLLKLVIAELAPPPPPAEPPPVAPPEDFEETGSRWAGWWRDDLPATPEPERELVERAVASVPPALAAIVVLHDVEGIGADELTALTGLTPDDQLDLLHHGRVAVRTALRAAREGSP
jgi:DNA-directed RNA polymerase specialized sigma24 family protein